MRSSRRGLRAPRALTLALLCAALAAATAASAAAAPVAVVPRNDRAAILDAARFAVGGRLRSSPQLDRQLAEVASRLRSEHYRVRTFGPSFADLSALLRFGPSVVVLNTHGDAGDALGEPGLAIQYEPSASAATHVYSQLLKQDRRWAHWAIVAPLADARTHTDSAVHAIGLTQAGVSHFFSGRRLSLVDALACESSVFARDFHALAYFGYKPKVCISDLLSDTVNLFERLTGGAGVERRTTTAALADLAPRDGYQLAPGSRPLVLSPAVESVSPSDGAYVAPGSSRRVDVDFDARMDPRNPLADVSASGCGAKLVRARWSRGDTRLSFELKLPRSPRSKTIRLRLHAARTRAAPGTGANDELDGNEEHDSGRAPNGDDYVWELSCSGPEITLHVTGAAHFDYHSGASASSELSRTSGLCQPTSLGQFFQYNDTIPGVGHFAMLLAPVGTSPFPLGKTYTFPHAAEQSAEVLFEVGTTTWDAGYVASGPGAGAGSFTLQTLTKPGAIDLTLSGAINTSLPAVHVSGSWHC